MTDIAEAHQETFAPTEPPMHPGSSRCSLGATAQRSQAPDQPRGREMEQLEVNDAVTAERTHDTRTVALWPVLRLARHRLVTGAPAPASGAARHRMAGRSVLLTLGLLTVALAGCTSPAGSP